MTSDPRLATRPGLKQAIIDRLHAEAPVVVAAEVVAAEPDLDR